MPEMAAASSPSRPDPPPGHRASPRTTVTALSVAVLLGLVGAASCVERTTPPQTVESLREQSPTLQDNARLRIGVRGDLPAVSHFDPETGEYTGFEIEIAKAIAAELGYPENRIEWVPIRTLPDREHVLQSDQADLVVANFSMTEERDRFVDFAGPYQLVPQAVLVRRERTESLETIAGLSAPDVRVCTTTGSTSARTLREKEISADLVDTNEHCMAGMRSGTYDAYSTDLPILAGFLSQDPDTFEILELAIADHSEQIGIGVPDGDVALRDLINYFLDHWQQGPEVASPWLRAYDRTIGPYLGPVHRAQPRVVDPPELADYDSRAPRRP